MSASPASAVFLSYASQDAAAARRICESLRAAGVEVWFDENELTGGDAWDRKIRGQVATCALFLPVISANTQARLEGYFRIEWKLAAQRTYAMADEKLFLLPVVIDDTRDADARVPAEFKAVQWTRLPAGETPAKFCARVRTLLEGAATAAPPRADDAPRREPSPIRRSPAIPRRGLALLAAALVIAVGGYVWLRRAPGPGAASEPGAGPLPTSADRAAAPASRARQLADRANALSLKKYNSTADDFAAAEGLLKEAIALDQNDAEIWAISSLFNTAIRTRGFDPSPARREAARSQAERALKLNPDSTEALFALGRWQRDHEPDPAIAEKTFLAVLARDPVHEQALSSLATHYDRTGRFEESMTLFERAARIPSAAALARYGQYLATFNRRRFDEAERYVRESVALQPSANSVAGLAMVLLTARGDAPAAVRALADLPVEHRSGHRAVWISAFAHLAARDPEAALVALRRLPADFILDNWFRGPTAYWIGRAHAQAGRPEAARIAFESGLAITDARLAATPGDLDLRLARGELLAWLGRSDEALREARTVAELIGQRVDESWFASPVRIHAVLGRAGDAVPELEELLVRRDMPVQWPLTPELLRIDPLWDPLRGDARFQALAAAPPAREKAVAGDATRAAE